MRRLFVLDTQKDRERACEAVREAEKGCWVEIGPPKSRRSRAQNNLYWLWLKTISDETGYQVDELHAMLRALFLGYRTVEIYGRMVAIPTSTTTLTVRQMSEYLHEIDRWAREADVMLPHPDQVYEEAML